MTSQPTRPANDVDRVIRVLSIACFGLLAAMSVLFVLTVAIRPAESAVTAPIAAPVYSVDSFKMVQWCPGAMAVYASPDGRLWTWLGAWSQVKADYSSAEFCEAPSLQLR